MGERAAAPAGTHIMHRKMFYIVFVLVWAFDVTGDVRGSVTRILRTKKK